MAWSDPPLQRPILSCRSLPPDPPPLPPLRPPRPPPCIRLTASWHRLSHSFLPPFGQNISKIICVLLSEFILYLISRTRYLFPPSASLPSSISHSQNPDSELELHSALVPTLPQVRLSANSAFVPFTVFLNSALVEPLPLTSLLPSTMLLPSLLKVKN